ncbi:MAG TPA: sugar phosphate isomerase/epimerase family protein [Tepidisphaeraceae bacterium]|nr:sugar phosphate isomerase/epimerase family protein [Tepidisphaeraceae bacterium]
MDVGIRDAMLPGLGGREFFAHLRELGVRSLEIEVAADLTTPLIRRDDGSPYSVADEDGSISLARRLNAEGVHACALLVATDFSAPPVDDHIHWAVRAVQAAAEMGVPVVRVDPLARDRSLPGDHVRDAFVRSVARVLKHTADTGVDLGIENHGPMANDPQFLDELFAAIETPRLGLTLDTGNFYWFGHPLSDVYRIIERYAPRAKHTHVKNINYPPDLAEQRRPVGLDYGKYCCPLDEGNLDLRRVVAILRAAGYDRTLCVEDESIGKAPQETKLAVLRRDVDAVRDALAHAG